MLTAIFAFLISLIYHLTMESAISADDFEPKESFSSYFSDFKFCALAGALVFFPVVFIGASLGLLYANSYIAGAALILVAIAIIYISHRGKNT